MHALRASVWSFGETSGPSGVDRPSLAITLLNGVVAVAADRNHRIILIDPKAERVGWQDGHTGDADSALDDHSEPDVVDLIAPVGAQLRRSRTFHG